MGKAVRNEAYDSYNNMLLPSDEKEMEVLINNMKQENAFRDLKKNMSLKCKYPPRFVYGKSVWAELWNYESKLCFSGHERYIQTVDESEITAFAIGGDGDVYIMAQCESRPLVLSFFCSDTGIYSRSFRLYGSFSICLADSSDLHDYCEEGRLYQSFIHINPDNEDDCKKAYSLLCSWRNQDEEDFKIIVGDVPHISKQICSILDRWESKGSISKRKCFQKISELMEANGVMQLEDAVDFDISDWYIEYYNEYMNSKEQ